MEELKLVGYFKNSFTDEKTGKIIEFCKLWASSPREGVIGERTYEYKVAVPAYEELCTIKVGSKFIPLFDPYGRVVAFQVYGR